MGDFILLDHPKNPHPLEKNKNKNRPAVGADTDRGQVI
jgi:hypothetical protein